MPAPFPEAGILSANPSVLLTNRLLAQHFLPFFRILLFLSWRGGKSEFQNLADSLDIMNAQVRELLGRQVLFHIHLIVRRQDDIVNPRPLGRQDLLFYSSDGKHVST